MEQIEIKKIEDIDEKKIKIIISRIGRKGFCSEADFQFSLAWELQKHIKNDEIRVMLEHMYETEEEEIDKNGNKTIKKKYKYTDILIIQENKWLPIELKFRKKTATIVENDGYTYILKNHGAKDIGCYNYLKDIYRIEKMKKDQEKGQYKFVKGFAIMITNDTNYLTKPDNECDYVNFSIHVGRKFKKEYDDKGNEIIELDWINKTGNKWYEKSKNYREKIQISECDVKWYKYPKCDNHIELEKDIQKEKDSKNFYLLINEIKGISND